jgi:hypothetical protein
MCICHGSQRRSQSDWDAETIAELTAEYRRQSNIRGYTISRWYKRSGRPNHRLDCMVYALAALSLSRLKIDDCEVQRVEARNVGENEAKKNAAAVKWGPQKMVAGSDAGIGGVAGFGAEPPDCPQRTGFWCGSGKWPQLLILGQARRCWPPCKWSSCRICLAGSDNC